MVERLCWFKSSRPHNKDLWETMGPLIFIADRPSSSFYCALIECVTNGIDDFVFDRDSGRLQSQHRNACFGQQSVLPLVPNLLDGIRLVLASVHLQCKYRRFVHRIEDEKVAMGVRVGYERPVLRIRYAGDVQNTGEPVVHDEAERMGDSAVFYIPEHCCDDVFRFLLCYSEQTVSHVGKDRCVVVVHEVEYRIDTGPSSLEF